MYNTECLTSILAIGLELLLQATRHVFLLSYLLSIDPVLEIESPQAGHSDAFVGEAAVEEPGPPFEREARPLLQRLVAGQEVYVLLRKLGLLSLSRPALGLYSISTDMLHSVVRNAKCL